MDNLKAEYEKAQPEYRMAQRKTLVAVENVTELLQNQIVIDSIKSRIKEFESVVEKCDRKNYENTDGQPYYDINTIRNYMQDVVGIRIITLYRTDVYKIYEAIKNTELVISHVDDYIKSPKESGYRSLHLVVMVQIPTNDGTKLVPAEIQLRTKAMDLWATLDHEFRYKNDDPDPESIALLQGLAVTIDETDEKAERIRSKKPAL